MKLHRLQKSALIYAPMPKSASNTLLKRVASCINCDIIMPKSSGGIGHFIIDKKPLLRAYKSIFTHKMPFIYQHFLPLEKNRQHLTKHLNCDTPPKVIVSVRNIYDVAISCADHQQNTIGPWWITREEKTFFNEEGAEFHSHMWNTLICLKFYAAWAIAAQTGKWDVCFVNYDDITKNPESCLTTIFDFYNINFNKIDADKLLTISDNVNVGKNQRGEALETKHKEMLQKFAASFKGIDFSLLGL